MIIFDRAFARARELEESKLWRRAARQWLTVLDNLPASQEQQRSHIIARRARCITMGNCFCNDYAGISEARLVVPTDMGVAA